jgi:uncharacterized protein
VTLPIVVCGACGRAAFPPPYLCPRCGAREWRDEQAAFGTLEEVVERGQVRLGEVRLPQGPLVIARIEGDVRVGVEVELSLDHDVPVAGIELRYGQ